MSDNAPETTASDNALIGDYTPQESAAPAVEEGQAPESTPAASPEESNWMSGFDEDTQAYLNNKGFKEPSHVVESYRQLESMRGVPAEQLFTIKPDMEQDGYDKVYNALGRPESADKYTLESGENDIPGLVDWFKGTAHNLGFNDKQTSSLYEAFNEQIVSIANQNQQEIATKHTQGIEALQKEWGGKFEYNANLANRAADYLGVSQDAQEAIKASGHAPEILKALAKAGAMMSEGEMAGVNPSASRAAMGGMDASEARKEIDKLNADPQFNARMNSGDAKVRQAAMAELDEYYKVLAQGRG